MELNGTNQFVLYSMLMMLIYWMKTWIPQRKIRKLCERLLGRLV